MILFMCAELAEKSNDDSAKNNNKMRGDNIK